MGYFFLPKFMCIGCESACTNFVKTIKQLEKTTELMKKEMVKFSDKTPDEIYKSIGKSKDAWGEPIIIKIINPETKKFLLYSKGWNRIDDNSQGDDISLLNKDKTLEMYCIHCEENNISC